jgi:hypothetical protein
MLFSVFDATDDCRLPSVDPRSEVSVRSYGGLVDSEGGIEDSLVAWQCGRLEFVEGFSFAQDLSEF